MGTDLSTQLVAAQSSKTQFSAQIAIVKQNHEMEMALVEMVDQVARSAPPPGQGAKVDKLA
jgi:hypothetical protein